MDFSNAGLGIVHSMAHPLDALYDTPHDIANAIILSTVMEYNAEAIGIPADLKEIVKKEDIAFLAQSAFYDACRHGNPKDTSVEDITALYESLL